MNILILGGTVFLGRHLVLAAQARGHQITLFNRGKSNPDLFPDVETLIGDRKASELDALKGRTWDAVIDTCGYVPRFVQESAELLKNSVKHYTFHSSISVYADYAKPGIDETYPVGTLEDPTVEEVTGETYGPLKALCEAAVEAALPGRALNIRPGLIVGPNDVSDRFTYWPVRIAQGGEVLAPGNPETPVQIIDVRDLAEWNIRMIEDSAVGVYNATGPARTLTMGEMLETCRAVSGSDARLVWADEAFLAKEELAAWSDLPVWVPDSEGEGFSRVDCSQAIGQGLTFRPLADTVRDTLEWHATRPQETTLRAGMTREREATALEHWKTHSES
jgi:2'-hydroxyisoflavone reductase